MKISSQVLFITFILIIAAIFRFWDLGKVPPSPDWDEVAHGYNAYSIMTTGKDEYGVSYPIVLRSFDDYKPALYPYLVIPFIQLFDLTVLAVRIPSALFGVLTVLMTYFLVRELFKEKSPYLALIACLLLAISPWHIQFSRIAFESNVGVGLNVMAVVFFLKGLRKPAFLLIASFVMALNVYAYQSEKVFAPILALALVIIYKDRLLSLSKKYLITAVLIGFFVSLPMFLYLVSNKEALARAKGVSIFADITPFLKGNVERLADDYKNNDLIGIVLDNRRFVYVKTIVEGYISHFDINWLFLRGDIARHHAPGMGLLYLWELPFFLIGIYYLIFGDFSKKTKVVLCAWVLITPIPAAATSGVPHAVRTLNFLPAFQVFTAIGIIVSLSRISNIKYQIPALPAGRSNIQIRYLTSAMYFLFFLFNFLYFLNQYFVQQNYFHSADWQYGYEQAVNYIREVEGKYNKIVVSNQPHLDQSYMFFLFYLKYPPSDYQKESTFASGGFKEEHSYGKFEFRPIVWEKEKKDKTILYVGRPHDFPVSALANSVKQVYFLHGEPAITMVEGI